MPRKTHTRHKGSSKRRREIIRAALQCFIEYGFGQTTMEDIRKRSGASNGSIYHHFTSKEMLAAAVYLEGIAEYQNGFLGELKEHPQARAGIYAIVRYHLSWVREHPDWARYLWEMRHTESVAGAEAAIAERNRHFVKQLLAWVEPCVEAGTLRQLSIDLFLPLVIGPCQEYTRLWLAGRTRTELGAAVEELARAVWLAVRVEGER